MPKYYPINEEAAKLAKDMNSFSDYQPGSATTMFPLRSTRHQRNMKPLPLHPPICA